MSEGNRWYGDEGPIVDVAWLKARLGNLGVRVVDVRPASVYAAGHLAGALHADLYQPHLKLRDSSPEERRRFHAALEAEFGRFGVRPGERVIFYEDVGGPVAAYGVWLLDYAGHGGGALLDGGLDAWLAAGGGLTRSHPTADPSQVRLAPVADLLATADDLRRAIDQTGGSLPTILDTRSDREYRAGTIPTATHLEWVRTLTPEGRFRSPAEAEQLFRQAGVTPSKRVVTFCGSGYRAAHAYVALRALGNQQVANYAPSWNEWGREP